MDHHIKILAEAITHHHVKKLVQTHVTKLSFNEEAKHLIIHLDNAGPLHELDEKENDHHLNKGLAAIYGDDITYEFQLPSGTPHDRDKVSSRRVQY